MYGTIVHVDTDCVFLKTLFEGNTSVLIKSLFNIASIVESIWLGWVDVSHQHPAVQKKKLFLQHSNFHFQLLLLQILQVSNGILRCACSMLCFMVSQLPKQLKRKNNCQKIPIRCLAVSLDASSPVLLQMMILSPFLGGTFNSHLPWGWNVHCVCCNKWHSSKLQLHQPTARQFATWMKQSQLPAFGKGSNVKDKKFMLIHLHFKNPGHIDISCQLVARLFFSRSCPYFTESGIAADHFHLTSPALKPLNLPDDHFGKSTTSSIFSINPCQRTRQVFQIPKLMHFLGLSFHWSRYRTLHCGPARRSAMTNHRHQHCWSLTCFPVAVITGNVVVLIIVAVRNANIHSNLTYSHLQVEYIQQGWFGWWKFHLEGLNMCSPTPLRIMR